MNADRTSTARSLMTILNAMKYHGKENEEKRDDDT